MVQGVGCRVWGVGCRVEGIGLRIDGVAIEANPYDSVSLELELSDEVPFPS